MGTKAHARRQVSPQRASVLLDCGPRLHASIRRRLRASGHDVVDALAWLDAEEPEDAELAPIAAVIVSLDPARTRSGLAVLAEARRRVPHASRILIAPRSSRLVAPAILAGLVDRAWLAPIGARLVGLLDSVGPRRGPLSDVAPRVLALADVSSREARADHGR